MRTLLLVLAFLVAASGQQTEYVIVKPGSHEYHRPGCPVVRDAKGLVAMTRSQAEARGLVPHPGCDPATHPDNGSKPAPVVYVYVQPDGKYYHREHCPKAGASPKKMRLDDAAKKYWPCPTCKPPIRKR